MKYIKTLLVLIASSLIAATSVAATNQIAAVKTPTDTGDWTLTLAGSGSTTTSGTSESSLGLEVGLGHTGNLILPFEVGVRQKFGYDSANASVNHGTKVYADFTVVKLGNVEIQAGANVGATYGDVALGYTASPEAVAKLFLKKDVWAFGRVEYPYDITAGALQNRLDYTIGIGLSF